MKMHESEEILKDKTSKSGKAPLQVINLFGAPGVGKSATRSGLFWLSKVKGMSVEEVSEYAKHLVLSGRTWELQRDQLGVMAAQHHKMLILDGVYDFAVTDSPLMLASFYAPKDTPKSFGSMCEEYAARYDNINFFLTRDLSASFESEGRVHSREDSLRIEGEQKEFLSRLGCAWIDLEIDDVAPWSILEKLEELRPGSVPERGPLRPKGRVEAPISNARSRPRAMR